MITDTSTHILWTCVLVCVCVCGGFSKQSCICLLRTLYVLLQSVNAVLLRSSFLLNDKSSFWINIHIMWSYSVMYVGLYYGRWCHLNGNGLWDHHHCGFRLFDGLFKQYSLFVTKKRSLVNFKINIHLG